MNRKAKHTILFLALLAALICSLQYALEYCYRARVTQKFNKIFDHELDPGIMLFGSSVTYHGFDPAIISTETGTTSYNMGWDGLFFVQYESLIKEYLTYETNCKYIVIGCDIENLGKNALITRPDLFLAQINNDYVYYSLHQIEPEKIFRARYIPGYALTLMNKAYYCDILFASSNEDSRSGYEPIDATFDDSKNIDTFAARFDQAIYEELRSCINEINNRHIKVVLVFPPIYTEGYREISNIEWLKSKYKSLASKDVYFLDYTTDSLCNSKNYFCNYSHVNKTGATLFSKKFSTDLAKILHE